MVVITGEDVQKVDAEEIATSIVQVLQSLFTATRSVLIYPAENPTIVNMIDSAHQALMKLVPAEGSLDFSIMREKLVVNGEMLDDALQKRRIVQNFVEILEQKRLSSITFWTGLTRDDLRKFLTILAARTPARETEDATEIYEELREHGIEHIEVDEQVYVAISRREKVVDARATVAPEEDAALRALKDEVFARFISGEVKLADIDPAVAREIMSDPDKIVAMVQGMISAQGWDTEVEILPYRIDETRGILERVSELVRQVDDPQVRSKLNFELGRITAQIEAPQLTEMLLSSSGAGGTAQTGISDVVMPLLGDVKLEGIAASAIEKYRRLTDADSGDEWPTSRMKALESILRYAMASASPEVAGRLSRAIDQAGVDFQEIEQTASTTGAELANALMGGADAGLCEGVRGPALVVAATYLFENDHDDLGAMVMEKLAEKFMRQSEEARSTAAWQMRGLFKLLKDLGKEGYAAGLIDDVSTVIDKEQVALGAYSGLSRSMGELSGGQDPESVAAGIEGLGLGSGGPVSTNVLQSLMASDTGQVVQAVFESGDKSAQEAISKALLGMGDRAIPALIDTAQDSTDAETLSRVADSLRQLRSDPTPRIAARFSQELETFQVINLVSLLALVGNENSAASLAPLLASEDEAVRVEAVHALGRLGGKNALQMLLNVSVGIDVMTKAAAARELHEFHDYQAVKRLLEIISPKKKGELAEDETVMSAACRSLGEMRVQLAAPPLAEIALGTRKHEPHSEALRANATAALGMIGGEDGLKALKKLLKDQSMLVRSTAKKALGAR